MLVDIHSHLLPGVDDGAKDLNDSIELAKQAQKDGITHLILTPHHHNHRYVNHRMEILQDVQQLNDAYKNIGINLILHAAQEIRIRPTLVEDILFSNDFMSLDAKGRYYLIEMPTQSVPEYAFAVLSELIEEGITPVIAHPERNHLFAKKLNALYQLIEAGCLGQVTSHSYIGFYGNQLRQTSLMMMQHQLIHVIASDAHHITKRPFNLSQAYQQVSQEFDQQWVSYYQSNAQAILNGESINKKQPIKKKLFGLF